MVCHGIDEITQYSPRVYWGLSYQDVVMATTAVPVLLFRCCAAFVENV